MQNSQLYLVCLALLTTGCPTQSVLVTPSQTEMSAPVTSLTVDEFQQSVVLPACEPQGPSCRDAATAQLRAQANARGLVMTMCSAAGHPAYMNGVKPEEFDCYTIAAQAMQDGGLSALIDVCTAANSEPSQRGYCVREGLRTSAEDYPVLLRE